MGKITIYRFTVYDIRSDELVLSKRWGTLEAIAKIGGQAVETSALEADEAAVRSDIAGLTDIGFTPSSGSILRSVLEGTVGAEWRRLVTQAQLDETDILDAAYHDWLVARRLDNQATSLRLHALIRRYAIKIGENENLVDTTRGLVGAASSLWRAACLSNRLAVYEDVEDDDFVLTDRIIDKEFTSELSGRSAPDWAFFSHMRNARDSLMAIATAPDLRLLSRADIPAWTGLSYKECWIRHQTLLDRAVATFERTLNQ